MQRNFEPLRQQVENWRTQQLSAEAAKLTIYRIFHGRGSGRPETPGAESARAVFQSGERGVPTPNHVEPVERVHICVQGTRSDPAIQGNSETGELS